MGKGIIECSKCGARFFQINSEKICVQCRTSRPKAKLTNLRKSINKRKRKG